MNIDAESEARGPLYTFAIVSKNDLKPHEQINRSRIVELFSEITTDGVLKHPVIVDKNSLVVLDGHHRVTVLAKLGCIFVPACLVDYHNESIQVVSWRDHAQHTITKQSVLMAGITGRLFPPKTSRHIWPWRLNPRPVPLKTLIDLAKYADSWQQNSPVSL